MKIKLYQVDAFTDRLFSGNPAAVCPLDNWLDDNIMQSIAAENNLSETAFFVKENKGRYKLRWFTPTVEVDLCGHATLASSYVIFNMLNENLDEIVFNSMSGKLTVTREGELISLNFPARRPEKVEITDMLMKSNSIKPQAIYFNKKFLFLLNSKKEVINSEPNLDLIKLLDSDGLIITAPGEEVDFVSRYFAPHAGIPEDPVTGAAHTVLTPFWSERLGKEVMTAKQVSKRGGNLVCEDLGDRVKLSGNAVLYSVGEINL